jgi:hypothetical protein
MRKIVLYGFLCWSGKRDLYFELRVTERCAANRLRYNRRSYILKPFGFLCKSKTIRIFLLFLLITAVIYNYFGFRN